MKRIAVYSHVSSKILVELRALNFMRGGSSLLLRIWWMWTMAWKVISLGLRGRLRVLVVDFFEKEVEFFFEAREGHEGGVELLDGESFKFIHGKLLVYERIPKNYIHRRAYCKFMIHDYKVRLLLTRKFMTLK